MHIFSSLLVFIPIVFVVCAPFAEAKTGQPQGSKPANGSIRGRVTLNGRSISGVPVILTRKTFDGEDEPIARNKTDQEGRFRFANVPAGKLNLSAFAPALVFDDRYGPDGARITLSPGEALDGIELSLKRGGVITGKVSDSAGRPVVERRVTLTTVDEQYRQRGFDATVWQDVYTDDRGVYRIFGAPQGRYIVSAGEPPTQRPASAGPGNAYYPLTFHPGVADSSMATVIELAAGAESTGIDIVMGRVEKGFTVKGRIVDADTGKPVSNISYGYGVLYEGRGIGMIGRIDARSDSQGSFRIEGVPR